MSDTKVSSGSTIGFIGLLTIILVILKALGYLTWSWWLVFTPLVVSFVFGVLLVVGVLVVALKVANDEKKYNEKIDRLCAKYNDNWEQDKRFK